MNTEITLASCTRVSLVVATLNSERHLREALTSISNQTYAPHEVIVIDGGSIDSTKVIAESFPFVTFRKQEGIGYHRAWNQGIAISTGDVIGFLDSDDKLTPHAIELSMQALNSTSNIDLVFGKVKFFSDSVEIPPRFRRALLVGDYHAEVPGSMLVKRDLFMQFGTFPEDWEMLSDLAWFARLRTSEYRIFLHQHLVLEKRVHSDSLSNSFSWQSVYRSEMLRLGRETFRLIKERREIPNESGADPSPLQQFK